MTMSSDGGRDLEGKGQLEAVVILQCGVVEVEREIDVDDCRRSLASVILLRSQLTIVWYRERSAERQAQLSVELDTT
jgi:hypothetical protein